MAGGINRNTGSLSRESTLMIKMNVNTHIQNTETARVKTPTHLHVKTFQGLPLLK